MTIQDKSTFRLWPLGLALALALTACGEDNPQDNDNLGLSDPYHGQWRAARLAPGKTDPEPLGCLQTDAGLGIAMEISLSEFTMSRVIKEYTGRSARTCDGFDTLTSVTSAIIKRVGGNDESETIVFDSFIYTVKVRGQETVDLLNIMAICDRQDWQQQNYTHLDDQLKTCTEDNTIGVSIPLMARLNDSKALETKIQRQGKGLALSSRDTRDKNAKFEQNGYFAR